MLHLKYKLMDKNDLFFLLTARAENENSDSDDDDDDDDEDGDTVGGNVLNTCPTCINLDC